MSDQGLRFSLSWEAIKGPSSRVTSAALTIWIGDEVIWPVEREPQISADIQVDDLLSYLTEFWKPLILRQTYPIGARPERPSLLRSEAERRWSSQPAEVADHEDHIVGAFEEAHDLSRCFAGQFGLPAFWLLRNAERMILETPKALRSVPFNEAHDALVLVGDEIADRLASSSEQRWSDLIGAWHERDQGDPAILLSWSASLDRDTAKTFVTEGILSAPMNVEDAAHDDDELRIAARMAGSLPPEQIRQIIDHVRGFETKRAPKLDEIGASAVQHIKDHFGNHRPYEQGEAAAGFLRQRLGLTSVQPIDIFRLIDDFGAALHQEAVEPANLLALAVWGDRHGPAILLNTSGLRVGSTKLTRNGAARVTLAHELCHLLLDRGHALSAVEILDSRMPLDIERRAKAFAGEFLLPARVASDIWFAEKSPRSIDNIGTLIRTLSRRYGVTRSVAAWKLEHGLHRHDIDLRTLLDSVVANR